MHWCNGNTLDFHSRDYGIVPRMHDQFTECSSKEERLFWEQEAEIAKFSIQTNFPSQKDKRLHAQICKLIRRAKKTTFGWGSILKSRVEQDG